MQLCVTSPPTICSNDRRIVNDPLIYKYILITTIKLHITNTDGTQMSVNTIEIKTTYILYLFGNNIGECASRKSIGVIVNYQFM